MKITLSTTALLLLLVLSVVGCGPTRKEYAINEALLIDQTRVLENQLYSAQFRIQQLERENRKLRAQLEEKQSPLTAKEKSQPENSGTARSVPIAQPLDDAPEQSEREVAQMPVQRTQAAAVPQRSPAQPRRRQAISSAVAPYAVPNQGNRARLY